jgi:hypothetical protein
VFLSWNIVEELFTLEFCAQTNVEGLFTFMFCAQTNVEGLFTFVFCAQTNVEGLFTGVKRVGLPWISLSCSFFLFYCLSWFAI